MISLVKTGHYNNMDIKYLFEEYGTPKQEVIQKWIDEQVDHMNKYPNVRIFQDTYQRFIDMKLYLSRKE